MEELAQYEGDKQKDLGAFYTPRKLAEKMIEGLSLRGKTVYDPTSGYCGLIITALDQKVKEGETKEEAILEVYGCELDPEVHKRGLEELERWYGKELPQKVRDHFVCKDTLEFDPRDYWDDNGDVRKPVTKNRLGMNRRK